MVAGGFMAGASSPIRNQEMDDIGHRRPQAASVRSKVTFQPGIGPHSEAQTIKLAGDELDEFVALDFIDVQKITRAHDPPATNNGLLDGYS